jgi:deoxyribonuclease-4
LILGLHCSIREGFDRALSYAESLKAEALQVLPYRRHSDPEEEDYAGFVRSFDSTSIRRLYVHSRFVPNLALSEKNKRGNSVAHLSHEIGLAARLEADAFILHLGAYSESDSSSSGIVLAARSIAQACQDAEKEVPICVENVPGGGRRLGGTLEELADLAEALKKEKNSLPLSFCLDTAHAWAAGYSISSAEGMAHFLERAESLLGAELIQVFHLNDTQSEFGSCREHHALWGKGILGFDGLKFLLSLVRYQDCAGILESPKSGEAERQNFSELQALNLASP